MTYKGKTLKTLVPIPIGLIGNVIIIMTLVLRNNIGELTEILILRATLLHPNQNLTLLTFLWVGV